MCEGSDRKCERLEYRVLPNWSSDALGQVLILNSRCTGNALIKSIPEVLYVDLSLIAKGYGIDVITKYLQSQHVENYMVDIGGEVRTCGVTAISSPVAYLH